MTRIADDLKPLAFPIDKLLLLPGNPNLGDVEAVARLYKAVGQRKPIVARKNPDGTGTVIAGNTQLKAARDVLNWDEIAVSWADDLSEKEAVAYILGDNETAKRSQLDEEAALELIKEIEEEPILLEASGYDLSVVEEWQEKLDLLEDVVDFDFDPTEEEDDDPAPRSVAGPVIQYSIVFDDEAQQQLWFKFIRHLKRKYPEAETIGSRVAIWLGTISELNDD